MQLQSLVCHPNASLFLKVHGVWFSWKPGFVLGRPQPERHGQESGTQKADAVNPPIGVLTVQNDLMNVNRKPLASGFLWMNSQTERPSSTRFNAYLCAMLLEIKVCEELSVSTGS